MNTYLCRIEKDITGQLMLRVYSEGSPLELTEETNRADFVEIATARSLFPEEDVVWIDPHTPLNS